MCIIYKCIMFAAMYTIKWDRMIISDMINNLNMKISI